MCWTNTIAIPLVLKKPLIVYKVGTSSIFGGFISLYRDFMYRESQTMPTVEINPEFVFGPRDELWSYDNFYIYEGYHSYLTEEMAKCWLLCDYDGLYIRYDYWLSPKGRPDIKGVKDLSKFTITKRHSIF